MPHWSATTPVTADPGPLLQDVRDAMNSSSRRSYLIIERSEEKEVDQLGYGRPGSLARFADVVAASPLFRVVYRNPDATIFTLARLGSVPSLQLLAETGAHAAPVQASRTKRRHKP